MVQRLTKILKPRQETRSYIQIDNIKFNSCCCAIHSLFSPSMPIKSDFYAVFYPMGLYKYKKVFKLYVLHFKKVIFLSVASGQLGLKPKSCLQPPFHVTSSSVNAMLISINSD